MRFRDARARQVPDRAQMRRIGGVARQGQPVAIRLRHAACRVIGIAVVRPRAAIVIGGMARRVIGEAAGRAAGDLRQPVGGERDAVGVIPRRAALRDAVAAQIIGVAIRPIDPIGGAQAAHIVIGETLAARRRDRIRDGGNVAGRVMAVGEILHPGRRKRAQPAVLIVSLA